MPKSSASPVVQSFTYGVGDISVLERWANTGSDNERATIYARIEAGVIRFPQQVWDEFRDAYGDVADAISAAVQAHKVRRKLAYIARAGNLVDELNSGFDYPESDICAAAVAVTERAPLVTVDATKPRFYQRIPCDVIELDELL